MHVTSWDEERVATGTQKRVSRFRMEDAERALTLPKVWWAYATTLPAAKRLSVWIANRTRLTPNQVTLISFGFVMVSALFFYQGGRAALIAGALFYQFNYLLDCVDGTVARMTRRGSLEGGFLDFFSDHVKNFIALLALSYGYYMRSWDAGIVLPAMIYLFLDQMYLLRDSRVDYMLRKTGTKFFTAPSTFTLSFAPMRGLIRWMSREKLYTRPTIVDAWMIVFFIAPIVNRVKTGLIAGCLLLGGIFLYQVARFFVLSSRSRRFTAKLLSNRVATIAVFGTGAMGRSFHEWAVSKGIAGKIIYAVDNDAAKWGRGGFPTEIVEPERLRKAEANVVIVASQHGYYDIAFQLSEMRYRPWKDFVGLAYS